VIRENAERLAKEAGIEIEFVRKQHVRKEELVAKVAQQRGDHPGLVHVLSAMERPRVLGVACRAAARERATPDSP
jgi:hypothetical protein